MSESGRRFGRFATSLPAILTSDEGERSEVHLVNLSVGGAFIETEQRLPLESGRTLSFALPKPAHQIETQSRVVWRTEEGLGLSFERLRPLDVWAILQFAAQPFPVEEAPPPSPPEAAEAPEALSFAALNETQTGSEQTQAEQTQAEQAESPMADAIEEPPAAAVERSEEQRELLALEAITEAELPLGGSVDELAADDSEAPQADESTEDSHAPAEWSEESAGELTGERGEEADATTLGEEPALEESEESPEWPAEESGDESADAAEGSTGALDWPYESSESGEDG